MAAIGPHTIRSACYLALAMLTLSQVAGRVLLEQTREELTVRCVLVPGRPTVADRFVLRIEAVPSRTDQEVRFPQSIALDAGLSLERSEQRLELSHDGRPQFVLALQLLADTPGQYDVGPIELVLVSDRRPPRTYRVPAVTVTVESRLNEPFDSRQMRPPPGPARLARSPWPAVLLAVVVLLAAGAWLGHRHVRIWWQHTLDRFHRRPAVPDEAVRLLRCCGQLIDPVQRREAAVEAIDVVLCWLRRELGMRETVTAEELVERLRAEAIWPRELVDALADVVYQWGRWKYAPCPQEPTAEEAVAVVRQSFEVAERYVALRKDSGRR